ncbi:3-hydroxyacyl-CoA dehydrogenase [Roseomonas gilardii]|uniref:3-hydroxyacyl-CoA dehydrogenase n=1 Tax=Roseomonas gilardii TaxID=257708 RepID=UPI00119DE826|nr:3-hydroxyacyl-CoA dehydrogenase [Roseomonas gilardii]
MRVCIAGSGLIGRAWGMIFARAGWEVRLWDPVEGVADKARTLCAEGLRNLAEHGLCQDPEGAAARIQAARDLAAALDGVDFVQENGPEVLEVKRALFRELDALAPHGAIIASSSSAIRCSLFTGDLPGRARCLIGHPVNPPHLVPVVEISGAGWTDPAVVARAREIYDAIGQVPVTVLREIEGFVLNRLQGALLAEAFRLVEEGYVTPEDLDRTVADGLGLRWSFLGPFATIELNAPGGIPDYCARYTGFYRRLAADPAGPEVFDEARTGEIMRQWPRRDDLPERMQWRDARLAALRAHKQEQETR